MVYLAQAAAGAAAVSFSRDIAPVLVQKCLACHGPEKSKGDFRLDTFERLKTPGASKEPPIVPGDPGRSKLFQLLTTPDADDRMPQKDDPLPPEQIASIEQWIRQGATFDGPDPQRVLAVLIVPEFHPPPPKVYPRPVPILALAFSPDGQELAAGGYHEVTLWNPGTGELLKRITNMARQTFSLAFSPDGKFLAAAGGSPGLGGEIKLFDPETGALIKRLQTAPDVLLAAAFSPNGAQLATGGSDNAIGLYDTATWRELWRIEQHADWVTALCFSHDGKRIAAASRDKTARVFDASNGDLETTYADHSEPVMAVAWAPDDKHVFSASRGREVHVWEGDTGKKIAEPGRFDGEIYRLLIRSNSLFSAAADGKVREHDLSGKRELKRAFSGLDDVVYSLALDEGSGRLAAAGYDGKVCVWRIEDGGLIHSFLAMPHP